MYIAGVTALDIAGLYLFGQEAEGWAREGLGAQDKREGFGQNRGRWFVPLPFGIAPVGEYPSTPSYNGRTYICGGYSYNLVLDEHHRLWKQGIRPPEAAPDISGAAGTTVLAYLSWWDELTSERSPLSKALEIGTGTPRTWNNLPTRPPDDVFVGNDLLTADTPLGPGQTLPLTLRYPFGGRIRQARPGDRYSFTGNVYGAVVYPKCTAVNVAPAPPPREPVILAEPWGEVSFAAAAVTLAPVVRPTHLELWLSIAGDLPRLAMRVAIGTTTVVESKGTADLGEAFITQFQRFPRCSMNTIYHDRQVVAGDSENPDTLYLSALFNPERFEGLTFRTRDGKAITGLLSTRDFCMVLTRSGAYLLQGYTDTDYTLNPVDQSIGAVGHLCNILVHGNPYVWSEKGPYVYNGGWHPLSPENRWIPPRHAHTMLATEDPYFNTYIVSQAFRAAGATQEPFAQWSETGVDPEGAPNVHKYFAVMDYTLVQPETGGAISPARLSWDAGDGLVMPQESGPPIISEADEEVLMKYLRNRYGKGNLYRTFANREFNTIGDEVWDLGMWDIDKPSFLVSGMLLPQASVQLNLGREEEGQIVTPFDYLGDAGGYLMEQKQIKRLWYYLRMLDGNVKMFVGPGPGYWGSRIYPLVAAPISVQTNFVAGDYRTAPEAPPTDVVMPVLPDFLSGRGMWLKIRGTRLFFAGFGVETIWGAEVVHPPV